MKKFMFIILVLIFMTGCASKSTYQPPEGCLNENGEQKKSVILKFVKHPKETALALKFATSVVAEEATPAHVEEMIAGIKIASAMLEDSTYSNLSGFLIDEVDRLHSKYSTQLMLVTDYAQDMIGIELPIYECDKALLKKHFKEQLTVLKGML